MPTKARDQGKKEHHTNITKIISLKKGWIHWIITILFTNSFRCLEQWGFRMQRQQWWNNGKSWRKFRHGSWRKSETKKEVIDEARTKGAQVHFASLMDICHLKNAELETKHPKNKGWVVLRGDIPGSYAVLTEQGSSASQTTAAKVMDIISRLPGCAGQAADASAYTQVKMEDARWPGEWGLQGVTFTGGGGPVKVPNLRVCKHPLVHRCDTRRERRVN